MNNSVEIVLTTRRWALRSWNLEGNPRLCMNCAAYRSWPTGPRCPECFGLETSALDRLETIPGVILRLRFVNRRMTRQELAEIMSQLPYARTPSQKEIRAWDKGSSILRNEAWVLAYILKVTVPDLATEPI